MVSFILTQTCISTLKIALCFWRAPRELRKCHLFQNTSSSAIYTLCTQQICYWDFFPLFNQKHLILCLVNTGVSHTLSTNSVENPRYVTSVAGVNLARVMFGSWTLLNGRKEAKLRFQSVPDSFKTRFTPKLKRHYPASERKDNFGARSFPPFLPSDCL